MGEDGIARACAVDDIARRWSTEGVRVREVLRGGDGGGCSNVPSTVIEGGTMRKYVGVGPGIGLGVVVDGGVVAVIGPV